MKKINQLDLFSGIGGFHLGFEKAGYEIKSYFSEIDKNSIAVYKHQFKDAEYVGSVTDVRGADLPRIDLITFGSPCQDFSVAGTRTGMEGKRSSLITHAIRLIHECRPRVFVWENVKGAFSSNNGADFWAIMQAFANIGGYRCEWQLVDTMWFLPQRRERIYLVGYLAEARGDWAGVFPLKGSGGEDKKPQETTYEIGDYRIDEGWRERLDGNCPTITAARGTITGHPLLMEQGYIRKLTPVELERLQGFPDNHTKYGDYNGVIKEVIPNIRFKQCGNAVTTDVVQAIAEKIKPLFK